MGRVGIQTEHWPRRPPEPEREQSVDERRPVAQRRWCALRLFERRRQPPSLLDEREWYREWLLRL